MLKRISSHTFVLLGMFILLNSCKKEYESIQSIDDRIIEDYIKNNNITAIQDPLKTGFYYQIENAGTGDLFTNTDTVLYDYTIKSLLNGTVYYSPSTIYNEGTRVGYAGQVLGGYPMPAIRTAILGLKPGGKARIFVPSYLAFGKNGVINAAKGINIPSNENIEITVTTYPEVHQTDLDDRKIQEFIAEKGLVAGPKEPSGVYYVVVQPGIPPGPDTEIDRTSSVKVKYTGRFLNGTQFDSNSDGISFVLAELAANWDVLTKFTKGAKVRLLIPSGQAYGTSGSNAIPPNAVLDFDIEIVDVTN